MTRRGIPRWVAVPVVLAGCARAPAPEAAAPQAVGPQAVLPAEAPYVRYPLQPVPVPPTFRAAVARGTRTLEGRAGPRYWQQRVSYRIDAELDPRTARLQGEQTLTYHNRSPDTLGIMVFHLRQNLFSEGVPRTRTVPITGGMTLERVEVAGTEARRAGPGFPAAPAGAPVYQVEGTLMYLRLPRPLTPADSVRVSFNWHYTVPPAGAPRTGHIDRILYNIAQWYPQVAVYDDVEGWHTWPYLGNGEFYQDYGDYDVSITVPEGWLVGATGTLQNADEVLTEEARARLAAALARDTIVRVVTADDLGPGRATRQAPGGQLTWRFVARDVRDFAWGTSSRYLWDATRAVVPGPGGRSEVVAVHALYRPEARSWQEAARYTRHALGFHAQHWHPYLYPQMTSLEGPIGGMEYPMLVFVRSFPDALTLYQVINHEVAHMWYPMLVGSKEPSYAWQDEGLATYIEHLATADFFPNISVAQAFQDDLQRYLAIAGTEAEAEIMRHADLFPSYGSFVVAAYSKPAVLLRALWGVVGEETVNRALQEYARRWLLRHPYALDFFNTVEAVAERDLDWFWRPWWYETSVLDQAIAAVTVEPAAGGQRVTVTVEDQGSAPMPVILVVTLENGETRRVVVPVEAWLTGPPRIARAIDVPGRVARVEIDPDLLFPDVDRADNVWVPTPPSRN